MAAKGMWEVDPDTRSKLAQLSKKEGAGNDKCCDCGAPSPQWASPKFSTFICLQCAGTHRGLGVHVSFVRSISMDAFKQNEILRMQRGGNQAWKDFYKSKSPPVAFEDATIKDRYDSEIGEEWKERLSCKVEDRPFDEAAFLKERQAALQRQASRSATPASGTKASTGTAGAGGAASRTESPAPSTKGRITAEQKAQNEAYFARMGEANASRSEALPPSQGGKYAGFGSAPPEPQAESAAMPSADDFSKDPMAALTKGFGWFSTAVTKQAKMVNDSYIQPTARNIASSDIAAQARTAAVAAGHGIQSGAKGAAESFNKFVEGQDEKASAAASSRHVEPERKDFWDSFGGAPAHNAEPERKDFWDSFGVSPDGAAGGKPNSSSSIGTSAMKKTSAAPGQAKQAKGDGWGDDW